MKTGALIVYTSADSVFQIAANEAIVPVEKLYEICAEARRMLVGKYGVGNTEGLKVTMELADRDFDGLAFVNLVDFDMLYGHRRDVAGYAAAAAEFNDWLPTFMDKMRPDDILMVTADHGCDPSYTKTTDHTREYVPFLIYGKNLRHGVDLGTRYCFGTIANTVCDALDVKACLAGCSVWNEIKE